ncbi:hypothetical protein WSM22_38000 [Cytophagales bacterium WSM2-2]|nr:hypothetical protein WSM22_38000 [Cytophagales bacterium WSM2-2]
MMAQSNAVNSGVYKWTDPLAKTNKDKSAKILEGISDHFEYLEIRSIAQLTGARPVAIPANDDVETCLIIKEGTLQVTVGSRNAVLGSSGVILIMPHQAYSIMNIGKGNLVYYEMRYRSKKKMDLDRGQASGGTIILNADSLKFAPSARGGGRPYFDRPTAMCERFEMHVTQLNKIGASHAPHAHAETEIILMISGETEMTIDGKDYKGSAGDLYIVNSQLVHGIRNATDAPCTYFAFKWK